jgi:hypothetical protein
MALPAHGMQHDALCHTHTPPLRHGLITKKAITLNRLVRLVELFFIRSRVLDMGAVLLTPHWKLTRWTLRDRGSAFALYFRRSLLVTTVPNSQDASIQL